MMNDHLLPKNESAVAVVANDDRENCRCNDNSKHNNQDNAAAIASNRRRRRSLSVFVIAVCAAAFCIAAGGTTAFVLIKYYYDNNYYSIGVSPLNDEDVHQHQQQKHQDIVYASSNVRKSRTYPKEEGGNSASSNTDSMAERTQEETQPVQAVPVSFVRRNLVSSFQTATVHAKKKPIPETDDNTKDSNTNNNVNIDEPIDGYKTTYHYTTPKQQTSVDVVPIEQQQQQQYFLKDSVASRLNDKDAFNPRIAWLASFPNSGTSFTMTLVARATNTTFATNYGLEANYGSKEYPSLPIYPRHPEGPYMPDPQTSYHHRKLPYGKHVITKTHCGGYCVNCGPDEYAYGYNKHKNNNNDEPGGDSAQGEEFLPPPAVPAVSFLKDCASGHAIDFRGNMVEVSYPPERASRVIHLIRNPFHNVIARFHLERKHHRDANTTEDEQWLEEHPDNHEGMNKFCEEQNELRKPEETEFFQNSDFFRKDGSSSKNGGSNDNGDDEEEAELSFARRNGDHHSSTESVFSKAYENNPSWSEIVSRVPCRGDFFRYVQWHNLLHESLDYVPHVLPVLTVYYEDYQAPTYDRTARSILDFLELQPVPGDKRGNIKWAEFKSRTDYDGYFSDAQAEDVRDFLFTLSSFKVWGEIEHYLR